MPFDGSMDITSGVAGEWGAHQYTTNLGQSRNGIIFYNYLN